MLQSTSTTVQHATELDFAPLNGTLTFLANESFGNETIDIEILADGEREGNEEFRILLFEGNVTAAADAETIPYDDRDARYVNATYAYHLYQKEAVLWIRGPNDS